MSESEIVAAVRPVKYIYSDSTCKLADAHPRVRNRASMVHDLIVNFKLLEAENVKIIPAKPANEYDLRSFHSSDYVELLSRFNAVIGDSEGETSESETESGDEVELEGTDANELELFGLVYDCAPFRRLWHYAQAIAGSSMSAFDEISKYFRQRSEYEQSLKDLNGCESSQRPKAPIVINWFGGWHHAHRDCAAGFCYVNDIVIGILRFLASTSSVSPPKAKRAMLSRGNPVSEPTNTCDTENSKEETSPRSDLVHVLYVDLDAHHGDAVQTAFYASASVYTISVHRFSAGFYPGSSGSSEERGERAGAFASLNIPLKAGCSDTQFVKVCRAALREAHRSFTPRCIVLQCGADALSGDPSGSQFSLTPSAYVQVLREIAVSLFADVPLVLLGGGGYVQANAARLWTALTSVCVLNRFDADADVPVECSYVEQYTPLLSMRIEPSRMPNENTEEGIEQLIGRISEQFEQFRQLHSLRKC